MPLRTHGALRHAHSDCAVDRLAAVGEEYRSRSQYNFTVSDDRVQCQRHTSTHREFLTLSIEPRAGLSDCRDLYRLSPSVSAPCIALVTFEGYVAGLVCHLYTFTMSA